MSRGQGSTIGVTLKIPSPCRESAPEAPELVDGSAKMLPTMVVEFATFQVSFPEYRFSDSLNGKADLVGDDVSIDSTRDTCVSRFHAVIRPEEPEPILQK